MNIVTYYKMITTFCANFKNAQTIKLFVIYRLSLKLILACIKILSKMILALIG